MIIERHGAAADHGTYYIDLKRPEVAWDSAESSLRLTARKVGDFDTSANHDYEVEISIGEFSQMLVALGEAPADEWPDTLDDELAPTLRAMLRLVSLCIGPTSKPQPGEPAGE